MPTSVELHLKPILTAGERQVPGKDLIEREYAVRLLEELGVAVTPHNVERINKELPIDQALVMPVWARGSVVIFPGCLNFRESDKNELLEQMFKPKEESHSSKSTNRKHQPPAEAPKRKPPQEVQREQKKPQKKQMVDESPPVFVPTNTQKGRRVSWATVHTMDALDQKGTQRAALSQADMQNSQFLRLIDPPPFGESDVESTISLFCASLVDYSPRIKKDFSGRLFTNIKALLTSPLSVRLYGLLCHYCYWNVMHPWFRSQRKRAGLGLAPAPAPAGLHSPQDGDGDYQCDDEVSLRSLESLAASDKEQLFVQLEECLTALHKRMGCDAAALTTAHQSHVCACHFVVDGLLSTAYTWLSQQSPAERRQQELDALRANEALESEIRAAAAEPLEADTSPVAKGIALQLRRLMHQALADILDPARIFTQHMLISSFVGEDQQQSIAPRNPAAKYYITSLAVRSVFGDAHSDKTRRFLNNTNEPYVAVPGVVSATSSAAAAAAAAAARATFKVRQSRLPVLSSTNMSASTLVGSPDKPGRMGLGLPEAVPDTVPQSTALPPRRALDSSFVFSDNKKPVAAAAATAAAATATADVTTSTSSMRSSSKSSSHSHSQQRLKKKKQEQGQEATGQRGLKAILKQARESRASLVADKVVPLALRLTECWEEEGFLLSAQQKDERERERRAKAEAENAAALKRAQANRKEVDYFNIFGQLGWDEAAVAHAEQSRSPGGHLGVTKPLPQSPPSPTNEDDHSIDSGVSPGVSRASSLVDNPRAQVPISITAKARLMGLVSDRSASHYTRLKSDIRPSLLLAPKI